MKPAAKPTQLKLLALTAGLLGFLLRAVLFATGIDHKGLLVTGHWADISVWVLTGLMALGIFWFCRDLKAPASYQAAFPASVAGAVGCILAGAAFVFCPVEVTGSNLVMAELVLRYGSVAALICLGFCRFTGRKPFFLMHCIVCLYLALRLVCQYRIWSADPQVQNYCFYMGAHLALMLTAYQLAAFDADTGSHRNLWISGLSAVFLCLTALANCVEPFLLLCCSIWIFTNLSCLNPQSVPHQEDA